MIETQLKRVKFEDTTPHQFRTWEYLILVLMEVKVVKIYIYFQAVSAKNFDFSYYNTYFVTYDKLSLLWQKETKSRNRSRKTLHKERKVGAKLGEVVLLRKKQNIERQPFAETISKILPFDIKFD